MSDEAIRTAFQWLLRAVAYKGLRAENPGHARLFDGDLSVFETITRFGGDVYETAKAFSLPPIDIMNVYVRLSSNTVEQITEALRTRDERLAAEDARRHEQRLAEIAEMRAQRLRVERMIRRIKAGKADELQWMTPLSDKVKRRLLRIGVISLDDLVGLVERGDRNAEVRLFLETIKGSLEHL